MLETVKLASDCIQNSQTQAQTQTQTELVGMHLLLSAKLANTIRSQNHGFYILFLTEFPKFPWLFQNLQGFSRHIWIINMHFLNGLYLATGYVY